MTTNVKTSKNGIPYINKILKQKKTVYCSVQLQRIEHNDPTNDTVSLKVGRYKNSEFPFDQQELEIENPKSELTLDHDEFKALIDFLCDNYEPFRVGIKKYLPLNNEVNDGLITNLKLLASNNDKQQLVKIISENELLPEDVIAGIQVQRKLKNIQEFESMLFQGLAEQEWQEWFEDNSWILGSEFVKILDERKIDSSHITDFIMKAHDGFLDIVEIKKPDTQQKFWSDTKDHDNYVPSNELVKAITQSIRYIYEIEREANSVKFLEKTEGVKTIKPRCLLIFGRSHDWNKEQHEAYRILNSSYHNLSVLTYDHVLKRAKSILGVKGNETHKKD